MDMNNVVIIKNSFDLMGIAYKSLLENLIHKSTTNVPTRSCQKNLREESAKTATYFFRTRKPVSLCIGAHQESPQ
jgi:hypothetical protein